MHNHNHKGIKGKLLMLLCCLAPIAAIVLITPNGADTTNFGGGILPLYVIPALPVVASHYNAAYR
jgi:hypothetical protein